MGSTVLTPLYPLDRRVFGISNLTITVVYAVYVVGNLAVLFVRGVGDLELRPRVGAPRQIRSAGDPDARKRAPSFPPGVN